MGICLRIVPFQACAPSTLMETMGPGFTWKASLARLVPRIVFGRCQPHRRRQVLFFTKMSANVIERLADSSL